MAGIISKYFGRGNKKFTPPSPPPPPLAPNISVTSNPDPVPRLSGQRLLDVGSSVPTITYSSTKVMKRPEQKIKSHVLSYGSKSTRREGLYARSEYDLTEIAMAEDTEAYVRISFRKHFTTMTKNGWHPRSLNSKTLDYIRMRLNEFSLGSNIPIEEIIDNLASDLLKFSNAFLILKRDRKLSSGKPTRRFGILLEPIAGVFVADPTSMQVVQDDHGNIRGWQQHIDGKNDKPFRKEDVIHITFDKKSGFVFGTPALIPVLDDIRCLRRIEELVELLVNRHIFPLYHYKVGTDQRPAQIFDNNTSEVDMVRVAVEAMPSEGAFVSSERHSIEAVGIQGKALSAEPYLDYFESRVLAGLGLSSIDVGRGDTANRSTGQLLNLSMADQCLSYQKVMARALTFYLFIPLLEEGGFPITDQNLVYFMYQIIDQEARRLEESHVNQLYQNNLLTATEARQRIGHQPFTEEEWNDLYVQRVAIPLNISDELVMAKVNAQMAKLQPAAEKKIGTSSTQAGAGSKKSSANSNKLENTNRPENQGGKKMARTRPVNDVMAALLESFAEPWAVAQDDIVASISSHGYVENTIGFIFDKTINQVVEIASSTAVDWIQEGMDKFAKDAKLPENSFFVGDNFKHRFFNIMFKSQVHAAARKLRDRLAIQKLEGIVSRSVEIASVIDTYLDSLNDQLSGLQEAAINFGYTRAAMVSKLNHVFWNLKDNACDHCWDRAIEPIMLRGLSYPQLLVPHADCIDGFTWKQPILAQDGYDSAFWSTSTPAIRVDHVAASLPDRSAAVRLYLRNLSSKDINGEEYKVNVQIDNGKTLTFINGTKNRVTRGTKDTEEAIWTSPTSFRILDVAEGVHKIKVWLEDKDGEIKDPTDFPGVSAHSYKFLMNTSYGQHDEYSDGIHRHDPDDEPSGDHSHPHPPTNPMGLHQHTGQEEPTGAHTHDYQNSCGVHDYETHDPDNFLMDNLDHIPLEVFADANSIVDNLLDVPEAFAMVLDSMLENDYFEFDLEGEYSEDNIKTLRDAIASGVLDAKLSAQTRKKLSASTFCGPNKSFPVPDCAHVIAARRLIGRYKGPGSKQKILSCVSRKAKSMSCDSGEKKK